MRSGSYYAEKEIRNVLTDHPEGRALSDVIHDLSQHLPVPTLSAVLTELINKGLIDLTADRRLRWVDPDQ